VLHRQFGEDGRAHRAEDCVSALLVEKADGVARVTLNRPDVRNAFDDALIAELRQTLRDVAQDRSVRALVLAAAGTAFCAGADLNWMKRMAKYGYEENVADARALAEMLAALDRMPKPTIARVHGPAFAGGTGLVAACDIAVGTPEAKFCFSEAKLGLSPATISPYVLRAIGERAARRYFLSAEIFDAQEALRIGMLSALVPAAELDSFIAGLLKHLLAGGAEAHQRIKELLRDIVGRPIDEAVIAETAKRIAEIRVSPEGAEGIGAFLEKRKPSWTK
jgi:methylglutaconyl-CoA hydratase